MANIIFIPPGGFMGFAQQSVATKQLVQSAAGKGAGRARTKRRSPPGPVKRRKRVTTRKKRVVRRRRNGAKPARLVKGSAAAKRHMAKLRRMRKK